MLNEEQTHKLVMAISEKTKTLRRRVRSPQEYHELLLSGFKDKPWFSLDEQGIPCGNAEWVSNNIKEAMELMASGKIITDSIEVLDKLLEETTTKEHLANENIALILELVGSK